MKQPREKGMNLNNYLEWWIEWQFGPYKRDLVLADILDTITGNKTGNRFEQECCRRILDGYNEYKGE